MSVWTSKKRCGHKNSNHFLTSGIRGGKPTYLPTTLLWDDNTDFLIKLDMKPSMHLVEISIFSLNHVIVNLTKIMNNLSVDKNRHFLTPSPPHLVHVVFEWPLRGKFEQFIIKKSIDKCAAYGFHDCSMSIKCFIFGYSFSSSRCGCCSGCSIWCGSGCSSGSSCC